MTVRIMVSQELDPQERFDLYESISDTLAVHGKRPKSITFVRVPEAGAVAQA